ncbi:determination of affect [Branchiostoma belcheri]|nr:determination of affect [Branchiostoma belcheri]
MSNLRPDWHKIGGIRQDSNPGPLGSERNTLYRYATRPHNYNKPRTAVLKRDQHGFGFVLRGAKTLNPNVPFTPTLAHPALQYMESIDPNSVAERAGLKKGDFLLQINGEDVRRFTHAQVVELIRDSRDVVVMTVVTVDPELRAALQRQKEAQKRISIAVSSPRDEDEIVDLRREDSIAKEFPGGACPPDPPRNLAPSALASRLRCSRSPQAEVECSAQAHRSGMLPNHSVFACLFSEAIGTEPPRFSRPPVWTYDRTNGFPP